MMRPPRSALALPLLAFLFSLPAIAAARTPAETEQLVQRVLRHAILIDTHADTPQMMLDEDYDLAAPNSPYMISIPKMLEGHLGAEFFSIWVDVDWPEQDRIHRALDLIDAVDAQVARHSDVLEAARTAADVIRIHGEGKIAILMGLEGGHIIQGDPRALDIFYRLGVRYMTLTHTKDNKLGDSSGDQPQWNGLSPFGRQIVARMNRLGMMVDISHVSDKTFYDTLAVTRAPVIASHSSCRALCDAPRDMTDDMIRALAKNGGVMDINFYSAFLDPKFRSGREAISKQIDAAIAAARQERARQGKRLSYAEETAIQVKMEANLPQPSFTAIADHIDHAVKIGGVDHVGLGSDFDGIDAAPRGMDDVSKLPNLVRELVRRGYSEQDLDKILGGNVLRVMRRVEEVAHEMQAQGGKP
jgi:membrane dipeptidase